MNWYFMGLGKGKGQLPIGLDNSLLHELSGIYNDDSSCFPCISPSCQVQYKCVFHRFARQTHSTSQFDKTVLSKCVTHVGFDKMT